MLRSLFSGISGLRAHQTMLDVTGNNIANVNTTGFKSSQTQFQDTLSQMLQQRGRRPAGHRWHQPGAGRPRRAASPASRPTSRRAASQTTGRSTDMMIQGDGFFVVTQGRRARTTRGPGRSTSTRRPAGLPGEGALVQGWTAVNGVVDTNGPLTRPEGALGHARWPAVATTHGELRGQPATDGRDRHGPAPHGRPSTTRWAPHASSR